MVNAIYSGFTGGDGTQPEACQNWALSQFEVKHFALKNEAEIGGEPKKRPKSEGSSNGPRTCSITALTGRGHAASGLKQTQNIQWLYRGWWDTARSLSVLSSQSVWGQTLCPQKCWPIMLVSQYSATDSRYDFVLVICRPLKRPNWAHNFHWGAASIVEITWWLMHCILGLAYHWTVASTSRTAGQTLDCIKFANLTPTWY